MSINRKSIVLLVGVVVVLSTILATLAVANFINSAPAEAAPEARAEMLKFDVAEDMTRFAFDQTKTFDDGLPAHGSSFVTEGYIYEYGTLTDSNGVLADGLPEFPDKVIGRWACRGWFVGDAAHATEGVWVITNQVYNFGEDYGNVTLTSDGYESAAVGEAISRAITGGTGPYAQARGEMQQTLLGFNEGTEGVNLRFEVELLSEQTTSQVAANEATAEEVGVVEAPASANDEPQRAEDVADVDSQNNDSQMLYYRTDITLEEARNPF